jgi:hypothetical protein
MKQKNNENERSEKRPRNAHKNRADGKKPSEFNFYGKGGLESKPYGDRRTNDRRESVWR